MPPDSNDVHVKVGLVSDVHGNLPAFEAVLADARARGMDAVWCLGDLVGYGAQPDGCIELARTRCSLCLAGNHDLGVLDRIDISDFSAPAASAVRWTREHASQESLHFLGELEPTVRDQAIGLYHASPRDPVWEYVLSTAEAASCMDAMPDRISAIGHTHIALQFSRDGDETTGEAMAGGSELDLSAGEWLLNPGSAGQPRDGDPRAAWLALDLSTWKAQWRRVEYDIDAAAAAINAAGLPRSLGDRLRVGQ